MFRFFMIVLLSFSIDIFSQQVSGTVTDEDQNPLPAVLVFNLETEKKAYTDINGQFTIDAQASEELRFVRENFERTSRILSSSDFNYPFRVMIIRIPAEIEEVKVSTLRLTGDLNRDSRNLTRFDPVENLRREIGVPAPPDKPREKAADAKEDILKPLLRIPPLVNVQAVYDVISGKARKKKRLYRYEDLQDNIAWIQSKVPPAYFTEMNIPLKQIPEFLQFSMAQRPDLIKYIKARNVSKILFLLEETFPLYLNR